MRNEKPKKHTVVENPRIRKIDLLIRSDLMTDGDDYSAFSIVRPVDGILFALSTEKPPEFFEKFDEETREMKLTRRGREAVRKVARLVFDEEQKAGKEFDEHEILSSVLGLMNNDELRKDICQQDGKTP